MRLLILLMWFYFFHVFTSFHLYATLRKNKLAVQVYKNPRLCSPLSLVPSERCEINRNIDRGLIYGRVRMANPGSSRVSRDPFELLRALSKWRNLTFDPRPRGTPGLASVWRNSRRVDRQIKCKKLLKGLLLKWVRFIYF